MTTALYHRFDSQEALGDLFAGSDEDALVALRGKPALVRIPGTDANPRARLVSCLLHGNEDSGFRAVADLLRTPRRHPFDLWVFIGNVRAASTGGWFAHRYLDDQEDFNRVWGLTPLTTRMRRCAAAVLDELEGTDLEAALDLHNNTGENPFYAIAPSSVPETVELAAVCCDTLLLWGLRAHTLMEALQPRCPAIAVECGLPGVPEHADFAATVLDRFLSLDGLHGRQRPPEVYEIRVRVTVRPEVLFAFGGALTDELDLVLRPGLDAHNFGMLLAGTQLGQVDPESAMPLEARDLHGRDVTDRYFSIAEDGAVVLNEDVTPAMLSAAVQQVQRDCLFYGARHR